MLLALALVLATAFPSTNDTAWMRPESFRIAIGMQRDDVEKALIDGGWRPKPGKTKDQLFVDYTGEKALTLDFRKNRLTSVRFELFLPLDALKAAFDEERAYLRKTLGNPKKDLKAATVILYDHTLPNVMVVLSNDPKSENGKKGIGFVAVRYYDPVAASN